MQDNEEQIGPKNGGINNTFKLLARVLFMELTSMQEVMIRAYEETRQAQADFLSILPLDSIEAQVRRELMIRCDRQIQNFIKYSGLSKK